MKPSRLELGLLLGALLLFGAGYGFARVSSAPVRLGARGPARPPALEQAWRAHLAGRSADVLSELARLGADAALPLVRHEAALLRAVAESDVATLERVAEGQTGAPASVVAGAQRQLARGAAPPGRQRAWAERFVREFPRSWAAAGLASSAPR